MDYFKKAVSGVFFVSLFGIFGAIIGYLLRFVLTSNLSPGEYGLFYASLSLLGLLVLFKDLGLTQSLVYHISKFKTEKKLEKLKTSVFTVVLIQLIPALTITILVFIFADFFAINYLHLSGNLIKGVFVIKILAIAYFVQVFFSIIYSTFQGFQKMKFFAISDFCRILSWFVLTYFFILRGFSVLSPALGFLFSYILVSLVFSPFVLRLLPKVKPIFSKELTKKLLFYGFPLMLSTMAGVIIGYVDTILIAFFRSLEEVGIYQTAQPTARLLWYFAGAFAAVLFPLVTELKTKSVGSLETGVSLIYRYIWILIIPFALMAFSFSTEILSLFFGSFYAQGSSVLKILAVGALFFSITQINGTVLNGVGKPKNYTKIFYIGVVVNLIGNIILIPLIGITGAAIATLLTYMAMFLFSFTELKKFVKVTVPILDWAKTLLIGVFSLLFIYFLKNLLVINVLVEIFICFSVSIFIFFGLLVFFKIIDLKEISRLLKKIVKKS